MHVAAAAAIKLSNNVKMYTILLLVGFHKMYNRKSENDLLEVLKEFKFSELFEL